MFPTLQKNNKHNKGNICFPIISSGWTPGKVNKENKENKENKSLFSLFSKSLKK